MMSVATQATARAVRSRADVGGVSGTQSVPFQNVMRQRLHSATRLTQGVPWLCGPASRRVCYFVEAGRMNAVSHASRATHHEDRVRDPIGQ